MDTGLDAAQAKIIAKSRFGRLGLAGLLDKGGDRQFAEHKKRDGFLGHPFCQIHRVI